MSILDLDLLAWLTIILVIGKVVLMMRTRIPGDVMGLGIVFILMLTGAVSDEEALSCFSSTSVVLVGVLLVLATAMVHSGVVQWITRHILGKPRNINDALMRTMVPAALLSAFMSATPVVALMIGAVKEWARRIKIPPSKLLIPLSYAASMGGICTLIGTTPNLVISDLYESHTNEMLSFTVTTIPGLFCLIVGEIYILIMHKWIPVRKSPEESFESRYDYTVELTVPADCPHIGETLEEAHLFEVDGGHIVEIIRFDSEIISPVPKDEYIMGNDHLVYTGKINRILELRKSHHLVNSNRTVLNQKDVLSHKRKLQMATIDTSSPLIGMKMGELDFEEHHNVVLVAVAREGECLKDTPHNIVLRPSDTLLLEGDKLLPENYQGTLSFLDTIALPQNGKKTLVSSLIILGMAILSLTHTIPLLNCCVLAVMAMMLTKCLSIPQLQTAINWKMLMVFSGSVCLGKAMTTTGVSQLISDTLTHLPGASPFFCLAVVCLSSTIVTEFMSSVSAAAIFAPIALYIAHDLGVNSITFCVALMISISSSFSTPVGSETNTMVYGPGGYKFNDYLKVGIPLNIIILIANLFITTLIYPLR